MFIWCLAGIVISYGFTSVLISALSKPKKEKAMETWQDLWDNDYVLKESLMEIDGKAYKNTPFDWEDMVSIVVTVLYDNIITH